MHTNLFRQNPTDCKITIIYYILPFADSKWKL
jgi:hypothetical protein